MKRFLQFCLKVKLFFTKAQTIEFNGEMYRAKKIGTIKLSAYSVNEN